MSTQINSNQTRILLIGGNGQVGQSLLAKSKLCDDLIIKPILKNKLDLNEIEKIRPKLIKYILQFNPTHIINSTAYTSVDKAEIEKEKCLNINGNSLKIIGNICLKYNLPIIHYSTDYVFDGKKPKSLYLSETDKPNPINIYGISKLLGEINLIKSKCKCLILRTSWVFSKTGNNFVNTILKISKNQKNITIINDQIGTPTSSDFIAKQTLNICQQWPKGAKEKRYGIYHLTCKGYTTWYNFAKKIINIFKRNNPEISSEIIDEKYILKTSSNNFFKKSISNNPNKVVAKRPLNSKLSCDKVDKDFKIIRNHWLVELKKILS